MTVDYMLEVRLRGCRGGRGQKSKGGLSTEAPNGQTSRRSGNPRFMAFISGRGDSPSRQERLMDLKSTTFKCHVPFCVCVCVCVALRHMEKGTRPLRTNVERRSSAFQQ